MAPKLVAVVAQAGNAALLAGEAIDNTSRYRALCRGVRFRFAERSAWSRVFLALHRRLETATPPARDAAILVGLRQELGLLSQRLPVSPQALLHGLYDQFGRCAPPACDPGLVPGTALRGWLTAAASLARDHGNAAEATAGTGPADLGWR